MSTIAQEIRLQESGWNNQDHLASVTDRAGAQISRWILAWQTASHRRRLNRAIVRTSARFSQMNPEWDGFFFDTHFLLNRGRPIVARHTESPTSTDAMDLALAWSEQWPTLSMSQRKSYLLSLVPAAAEFLRQLMMELTRPHLTTTQDSRERTAQWRRLEAPRVYV